MGFDTELERIAEHWERHERLALHNDLTTCLRYGDLTVLLRADDEAAIGIEEVKAAGQRGMRRSQTQHLDERLAFLDANLQAGGADGPVSLQQLPIPYRTHSQVLAAVLAGARARGYADAQPEPALILAAVDYSQPPVREEELGERPWRLARERGWTPQDEFHHSRMALQTRMQERHGNLSYFAPVTIFPLPAEDLTNLLLGRLDYAVTLRAHALRPAFEGLGIEIEFPTGRDAEREFLRASRAGQTLTFPLHLRDQMLRELMSTETLVAIADFMLSALAAGASVEIKRMLFCDDREAWPAPPSISASAKGVNRQRTANAHPDRPHPASVPAQASLAPVRESAMRGLGGRRGVDLGSDARTARRIALAAQSETDVSGAKMPVGGQEQVRAPSFVADRSPVSLSGRGECCPDR